ncbi:Methane oxygenase PmoA [Geodermatophilus saharensis]|uniref:Methane oxygenase PmoA n=1 Tax=Geodermatophilus saharensis TaxID=1137994 RepID=A0A239D1D1_9ACTN|nr:PmoA family protein [Geodermatophilus saharensis]SNS26097.1 Methane oxygenase PmoA [Geodermatophilus saharensis]
MLATLAVGGVPVAEYADGGGLDPVLAPRPHLHPVRTLGGRTVTDAQPADHPWHLGVSVAVPDVGGANLWGGPTYLPEAGYTWREDHGRIEHAGFTAADPAGVDERLRWLVPGGEVVLTERRRLRARPAGPGWELGIGTALTNVSGRALALGSPATNGRAGAGYGGLFWRLPPGGAPSVRTADREGEEAVHGSVAPWLAWRDPGAGFTLALTGTDAATRADPWFVRVRDYPGVGWQLAARRPLVLPPGETVTRGFRALVVDGVLDDAAVADWASAGS